MKREDPVVTVDPKTRLSLRDIVVEGILNDVFERRFETGARLVVQRLAERFKVSPTPVREALVELAGLGIVELLPNRGAVVNPFGGAELEHISQVRRVLEIEACRSACGRMDLRQLQLTESDLKELNHKYAYRGRKWDRLAREVDTRLHLLIAEGCGNPRLSREIQRYLMLFWSLRNISHLRDTRHHYKRTNDVPQHLKIVRALIEVDADSAVKELDRHIRSITIVLRDLVFAKSPRRAVRMIDRRSERFLV